MCGGDAGIVGMLWSDGGAQLDCLKPILERCGPNMPGRASDGFHFTLLHSVAGARPHVTADQRRAFATALLDAGARTDLRDGLLRSASLGWASAGAGSS